MKQKSLDPTDRMGVYKRFEDVPQHRRLSLFSDEYAGRDVWQEFCEASEYDQGESDQFRQEVDRAGRRWKSFMDERDRHHALASPDDVEAWSQHLLQNLDFTPRHALSYWGRINRFYDWLMWHTEHPHVYNPVLMAAADGEAAGEIWAVKADRVRERRERGYGSRGES